MAAKQFRAIMPAVLLAAALASPLQAGASVTVKPTSQTFKSNGATGNIAVAFAGMTSASAQITASTSSQWISVTSVTPKNGTVQIRKGKGAGKVSYRVAKNDSSLSRTDVLAVNGTNVTVTQGGVPCKLTLSATKTALTASGGAASFSVTAPDGCGWSVATDSAWAAIAFGSNGSGSGDVSVSASVNNTVKPRTGKLTLTASDPATGQVSDKKTFTLTQAKGSVLTAPATALKVAEKVTVVDAKQPVTTATATALVLKAADIQTDFQKDATKVYVDERSAEAFDTVNNILCMISQSRYDLMLNKGAYAALIDENLCGSGGGQTTQAQQAQSSAPSYKNWTLISSRTDDGTPHVVKAWIHDTQGDQNTPSVIMANVQITEASSAANPYGIFTMNFIGYPVTSGVVDTSTTMMKGTLSAERDQSGKVFLKFVETEQRSQGQSSKAATLFKLTDGTGGGSIQQSGSDGSGSSNFAFNDNFFHRASDSEDVCLDRNAFDKSSWSYGLYDDAGARVNVNSGFPIRIGSNTSSAYGWVGYWGLWLPNNVTVANGDTVYRQSFNGTSDATPYTILKTGGKLLKHQRFTTTLGAIKNIPLSMWLNSGPNGQGNYNVQWNGSAFVITAWMPGNGGGTWQNLPSPSNLDLSSLQMSELDFWADGLGQGRVALTCTASAPAPGQPTVFSCGNVSDANEIIYYSQDIVYPGDAVPSTFACFDNCPDATKLSQAQPMKQDVQGMQNIPPAQAAYDTYTFDSARMILKDGMNDVTTTQTAMQGGVMSGALFDATVPANLAALACDWDATKTCSWQAWSRLNLFYTWQTGADSWNQLTLLKSANGSVLRFDPPLVVHYTHVQPDGGEPDARYNGVQFRLEYDGFGQLQGIPSTCISRSTGAVVDCSQSSGSDTSWVADFMINEGEKVTAETGNTQYTVKPLEIEEHMKSSSPSNCTNLPTTAAYQLPVITDWKDPAIGSEPSITAPPAVIGGVLQ